MDKPKRLGIFVAYDPQGIIDDYIPYLLCDMCRNLDHLVIVCNGFVNEEGLAKLGRFSEDLFVRDNIGYDAGAIKDVLYSLYGWDNVYRFDELVLFNDSFFGPLYPFSIVFEEMDRRELDFWGLVEQCELSFDECRQFHPHFQSFFTVVKSKLLKSRDYLDFWDTMPPLNTFYDAVYFFELRMNSFFIERGYKSEAFADFISLMPNKAGVSNEFVFTYEMPYETVVLCKNPIIKRRAFIADNKAILKSTNAEGHARLMEYIDRHTDYDVGLIWDYLLRVYDINDLRYTMHLDCVLSSRSAGSDNPVSAPNVAIIANVSNPVFLDALDGYFERIRATEANVSPCHVCDNLQENHPTHNTRHPTSVVDTRARIYHIGDAAAAQGDLSDYDYFCYIGDMRFDEGTALPIVRSAVNTVLENTIKSVEFVANIIDRFEKNPRLGLLSPPLPMHAQYFSSFGGDWGADFEEAHRIVKELGLRRELSGLKRPFMSESAFWCRSKALGFASGFILRNGPDPAHMKVLPYLVQEAGFYSAVVMSDDYAAVHSTNCEYVLAKLMELTYSGKNELNFNGFINSFKYRQMLDFALRFDIVHIYGAGDFAGRCADNLLAHDLGFAGFVVTDGRDKQDVFLGHKVRFLSEIEPPGDGVGIILGMDKGNTAQVFSMLRQIGYENLFVVT